MPGYVAKVEGVFPAHWMVPYWVTPQTKSIPTETEVNTPCIASSCPPQQLTAPSAVSPQVVMNPTDTALKAPLGGVTPPQQNRVLSDLMPHGSMPADIDVVNTSQ